MEIKVGEKPILFAFLPILIDKQMDGVDSEATINSSICIKTIEMHSGGEPLRIVESGWPALPGTERTLLQKRRYVRQFHDHLRKFIMHEPRGHHDMYGVLILEADHPEADFAVLFMHNEGYRFG